LAVLAAGIAVLPGVAVGQSLLGGAGTTLPPGRPDTFGTTSEIVHTVQAGDFNEIVGVANASTYGERYCTAPPNCTLIAGLRLPAGAVISRIELDACDDNPAGQVRFTLFRTNSPATQASLIQLAPIGETGQAALPGCANFSNQLIAPITIDNKNFNYFLDVGLTTDSSDVNFSAVRVYYSLQVSPAPATATFGDVPTSHPFFQFVQALVASGITAGCGGGNYCPDALLTRGQMAVFLSKALGLHFAP
jgi:hypothetical protein